MIILAIGMFALSKLQVVSVKTNTSAYQHSIASMLAYDMMDRMRINNVEAVNGNYNTGSPLTPSNATQPANLCKPGDPCSTSVLKDYDKWAWATGANMLAQLPNAEATITSATIDTDSVTSNPVAVNVTITIKWADLSTQGTGSYGNIDLSNKQQFTYSSIIRIN